MPKRISKRSADFRNGFTVGVNAAMMAVNLQVARENRKETLEDVSKATGIPVVALRGLEKCEPLVYLRTTLTQLTKLANHFGWALSVKYQSMFDGIAEGFEVQPPTWEEEFGSVKIKDLEVYSFITDKATEVPGKGTVYMIENPLESKDLNHLLSKVVRINGKLFEVTGIECRTPFDGVYRNGYKLGLIVKSKEE